MIDLQGRTVTLCLIPATCSSGTCRALTTGFEDLSGREGMEAITDAVSPDGRWVAVLLGGEDTPQGTRLALCALDDRAHPQPARVYPHVRDFAWSPNSQWLYLDGSDGTGHLLAPESGALIRANAPIVDAAWLDDTHLMGDRCSFASGSFDDDQPALRFIDTGGRQQRCVPLRAGMALDPRYRSTEDAIFAEMLHGDSAGDRVWHPVPGKPGWFVVATEHHMSDGGHEFCYLVNARTGVFRFLRPGQFFGFSWDGRRFLVADYQWVGPYKRGGERVGALEVVDTFTGRRLHRLSGPLMVIEDAEWRRP
jgi:hypothetical protein